MTDLHRFMVAIARFLLTMMVGVVLLLILWFGIKEVNLRFGDMMFGLLLTWHLFPVLLVFFLVIGFRFMPDPLLVLILLLGLTVWVFWFGFLPFWVPYIGLLVLLIWGILEFLFGASHSV